MQKSRILFDTVLPTDWNVGTIEDVTTIIYRYPTYYGIDYVETGIPEVRGELLLDSGVIERDLKKYRFISEETAKKFPRVRLESGDIVMSVRGTIGKIGIVHDEIAGAVITANLIRLSPLREKIFPEYFRFLLLSPKFVSELDAASPQTTIKTITAPSLKALQIPLPPLFEQRCIAQVLTTVQTTVEQQARLIVLARELKSALMRRLFSEGLRGEKQKRTELGLMPESWDVVSFSEGVDIKNGQVDPRAKPFSHMVHVGPENIERDTGHLHALMTNEELGIRSGNYYFNSDDILYSKIRPYLSKVALPNFEGTCSADMYPLRVKSDLFHRQFLFQFMLSEIFKEQAISHQDRTGIPKINRNQLGSILLPKPALDEQVEIAQMLTTIDVRLDKVDQKLGLLKELFHSLLHQLMEGQIRVNNVELPELS